MQKQSVEKVFHGGKELAAICKKVGITQDHQKDL